MSNVKLDRSKDSAKIGTIHENLAVNQFLKKKCFVFKNVCQHGPIDIVVLHPNGEIELLDVKKRSLRKRDNLPIHRSLSELQKKLNVKLFYIDDTNEGHYHPPKGLK